MLHFGRKLDIFRDVLMQSHNWANMKNKEKSPHVKDGAERGQKEPRSADLSAKYSSTLAGVLPKPSTRAAYICPEDAVKRERASRDDFQRSIRVRHKRKATPEASSSLGVVQVGGQQGIHPLPEISSP